MHAIPDHMLWTSQKPTQSTANLPILQNYRLQLVRLAILVRPAHCHHGETLEIMPFPKESISIGATLSLGIYYNIVVITIGKDCTANRHGTIFLTIQARHTYSTPIDVRLHQKMDRPKLPLWLLSDFILHWREEKHHWYHRRST